MKKIVLFLVSVFVLSVSAFASDRTTSVGISSSILYERGWDASLLVEHETRHHSSWEYSVTGYLKWEECPSCGHICPQSFWDSYNTWQVGVSYKPTVFRSRNMYGRLRVGGILGSDLHEVIGGVQVGYEHNYTMRHGTVIFWQVKEEIVVNGKDLFRTGFSLGIKFPL